MYGGSEAAAAGLHLSMGSLLEEQQRAPQMVSNLPNATPSLFYSRCASRQCIDLEKRLPCFGYYVLVCCVCILTLDLLSKSTAK